jgi:hypothetical protein
MAVMQYETYLIVNATQRLLNISLGNDFLYKSDAYRRCGKGLTEAQFDRVVQGLVDEGWLNTSESEKGATVLHYNYDQHKLLP